MCFALGYALIKKIFTNLLKMCQVLQKSQIAEQAEQNEAFVF